MKTFFASALCGSALQAIAEAHALKGEFQTLIVEHVESQSFCEYKNFRQIFAPGQELYVFDQDLCACVFNPDLVNFSFGQSGQESEDCVPSPLQPGECYLPCQIDEIRNHRLNSLCGAKVDDLPYDYREQTHFRHIHGQGQGFDDNAHFGEIEGCAGNVIHTAIYGVVYDEELPHFMHAEPFMSASEEESAQEEEAEESDMEEFPSEATEALEEATEEAEMADSTSKAEIEEASQGEAIEQSDQASADETAQEPAEPAYDSSEEQDKHGFLQGSESDEEESESQPAEPMAVLVPEIPSDTEQPVQIPETDIEIALPTYINLDSDEEPEQALESDLSSDDEEANDDQEGTADDQEAPTEVATNGQGVFIDLELPEEEPAMSDDDEPEMNQDVQDLSEDEEDQVESDIDQEDDISQNNSSAPAPQEEEEAAPEPARSAIPSWLRLFFL